MSCRQKGYEELKELLENSMICKVIIIFFSIITFLLFSYHTVYFIKNPDNLALVYIIVEGLGAILCLIVFGFWIYIKCENKEEETATVPNINPKKKEKRLEIIDEENFEGINPLISSKENKEKKSSKKLIVKEESSVNEENFEEENPIKKKQRKMSNSDK